MIVAMHNPRGGVGKTTTAVNLAAVQAFSGLRVLLVDLVPTACASISLGMQPQLRRPTIAETLVNPRLATKAIRRVPDIENLRLTPASMSMTQIDTALRHVRQPERRLEDA